MSGIELLAPLGIAAALAVPLVVLLHMRHTTPDPHPVPTLRFWVIAQEAPTERSRLRPPPITLLLLLQVLVVGALAFALTRPATADAWTSLGLRTEPKHVIILLDGSTSMGALDTGADGTRFEAARDLALDRVEDLQEGDVATLVLLGTRVTTFEATAAADFPAFRDRLAGLQPPGGRADLDAALSLAKDLLLPKLKDEIVLVSDGALSVDPALVAELGAPIELLRVGGETVGLAGGNLAITDVSARAVPGSPDRQQLLVRIANFSLEQVTVPVILTTDGIETSRQTESLPPNGQAVLDWGELPAGVADVVVSLDVQDAFPDDDAASLILRQESTLTLQILLVTDVPGPLHRALAALPGAQVTVEASDSPALQNLGSTYDLVVYENTAPKTEPLADAAFLFVRPEPDGPFFPTRGADADPTITSTLPDDPLLAHVDLAGLTFGEAPVYDLQPATDWTVVVDGDLGPLILRGTLQGRQSVVIAFDVGRSSITKDIAFPMLIQNIASQLVPSPLPPSVPLGDPLVYRPSADAAAVRITAPDGSSIDLRLPEIPPTAVGPEADALREVTFTDTGRPGEYRLVELGTDGEALGGGRFVVNAGHPAESDLRPNDELPATLATAGGADQAALGSDLFDLWPLFAAAALALLTLEWIIAVVPWRRPAVMVATAGPGIGGRGRR